MTYRSTKKTKQKGKKVQGTNAQKKKKGKNDMFIDWMVLGDLVS